MTDTAGLGHTFYRCDYVLPDDDDGEGVTRYHCDRPAVWVETHPGGAPKFGGRALCAEHAPLDAITPDATDQE